MFIGHYETARNMLAAGEVLPEEDISGIIDGQNMMLRMLRDLRSDSEAKSQAKEIYRKVNRLLVRYVNALNKKLNEESIETFEPSILVGLTSYATSANEPYLLNAVNLAGEKVKKHWHKRLKDFGDTWVDSRPVSLEEYCAAGKILEIEMSLLEELNQEEKER